MVIIVAMSNQNLHYKAILQSKSMLQSECDRT